MNDLKKQLKLFVPPTWNTTQKGKFFQDLIEEILKKEGFQTATNLRITGSEIDILAKNRTDNSHILLECKNMQKTIDSTIFHKSFSILTKCQLTKEIKNVKQAIICSVSGLNSDVTSCFKQLEDTNLMKFWGTEQIINKLLETQIINFPEIHKKYLNNSKVITLLITPELKAWVLEVIELNENQPSLAYVFPACFKQKTITIAKIKSYFEENNLWTNLSILEGNAPNKSSQEQEVNKNINKEHVALVNTSESFEIYQRPCQAQDFIGRKTIIKKFWDFLSDILENSNPTRIICFEGKTGIGKSSLAIKLKTDCFTHKQYTQKYYLCNIDVRSAKGKLFILNAIKKAIEEALKDKFIDLPSHSVYIESIEQSIFDNQSIKEILAYLKRHKKILVIFFDQFEELFTKESLFCVYEMFEELAYEIDSLKENIVLAFCWRTGILIPDDHKARGMWDKLRDIREEIEIPAFNDREVEQFLDLLQSYMKNKKTQLNQYTYKFLENRCSGLPWVLKKISSSMYSSDTNILSSQYHYKLPKIQKLLTDMFNKDLEILTSSEFRCLEYIAKNSPVKFDELIITYGQDTIKQLEENRFIIKSGVNYTVYWDIFKDFVLDKQLPQINLNYIPKTTVDVAWLFIDYSRKYGKKEGELTTITFKDLDIYKNKNYKTKTVKNILYTLSTFFGITYDSNNNKVFVPEFIIALSDQELANFLRDQLDDHVVALELFKTVKPGQKTTLWNIQNCFKRAYSHRDWLPKTCQDYTSRILSWFFFTGLLEKTHREKEFMRPLVQGKQQGKPAECKLSGLPDNTKINTLFDISQYST